MANDVFQLQDYGSCGSRRSQIILPYSSFGSFTNTSFSIKLKDNKDNTIMTDIQG